MRSAILLAMGAALALSACERPASGDEAAPGASPAAARQTSAPADFTVGEAPSREFIVGKWSEPGECDLALDFRIDGSMVGPFEKWTLEDGVLHMEGNEQRIVLTVVDERTLESRIGDAPPHRLVRCP